LYIAENKSVVRTLYLILFSLTWELSFSQSDPFITVRNMMVEEQIESRGITNEELLRAMKKVPRHLFVPEECIKSAYGDFPLPIGYDQTISQPYIVAYMTDLIKPGSNKKVLEIGTGSGYQAAILAELCDSVFSIEIIPELAIESSDRLKKLNYRNVFIKCGDGYNGWTEHSPFDCIVVTAAAENIPQPLIDQLADKGRLVIPIGGPYSVQDMILITKKHGEIEKRILAPVRFVPFKRL